MMRLLKLTAVLFFVFLIVGCGGRTAEYIPSDSVTMLSGRWNDTDSRMVSEEMIGDCLNRPWLTKFETLNNREPVVVVGSIYNKTSEHIATDTFMNDLERAYINSGLVNVVTSGDAREELRRERADQNEFAREETRARWREEIGADYILSGTVSSIQDSEGNKKIIFYQVNLELIDMETNQKVWIGDKKIKKYIH